MSTKILIVEDEIPIQQMYKLRLELAGYDITTANNGAEGLLSATSTQPHLIMLDLMMPIMDGTTMLEKLRATELGSNVKVIVLTNVSRDEAPRKLQFLHVDRYIVKAHHTPQQITQIVSEVLTGKL